MACDVIASCCCRSELGGVWHHRQLADRISLGEMDEDTDYTDDSALSTPLPDVTTESTADVAFFDPLAPDEDEVRHLL